MRNYADLSIGQRLAIGFGAVMVVVAVLLVLVFRWHADSVRAESAYSGRIAPLIDGVRAAERGILQVAIDLRALALNPSAGRLETARGSLDKARSAVGALGTATMDDDGRQLYARIAQGAGEYLRLADEVANRASEQGVSAEQEGELSAGREAVLSVMGQFAALQDVKAAAALDETALVRERMTEGLVAMAILTALILTVLALLTTRSVSGPTQTLVRTAGALIAGDWKPALALAPQAGIHNSRPRNELTRLAHAFGSAAVALERREQRLQESNERIQAQNEELQAQNEEIQTQSEELQSQHEEIQAQNEQLLQQGEELRRHVAQLAAADAHKNHFLGVLAHELRNPMTPITNSIYILRHTEPGSDGAKRAQAVIERQVTHLVRLVDDLLDVTRVSEGKIHIERRPLDLVEIVHACVEDLSSAFDHHETRLAVDVPALPVAVNGDRTRLSQVITNLLNNSIKFSERGNVRLSLAIDRQCREAVLTVVDDGVGMESELLPNLFQPFSQGISGLDRVNGGLGLGLALVKALVTLHDGKVAAHSDGPGRGAEFTIRLPLAALAELGEATPASLSRDGNGNGTPHSRRVLVVEDNLDSAATLREALELEGYDVALAHSGPDGLQAAASFKPDVVLCDVGLPGLDGYEVARRLRADPSARSAILIALTGYASAADKERAHSAGFDLHLAKPLMVSRFSETLAQLARPAK